MAVVAEAVGVVEALKELGLIKEVEGGGPLATLMGVGAGVLGFVGLLIPKGIVDLAAWIGSWFGADTRPTRLVKGLIDAALGGVILWDVLTHERDDFWRGAEWAFSVLELLAGGLLLVGALADYTSASLGGEQSIDIRLEKGLFELLTGKEIKK
jgi:hypothetical protein